MICDYRGFHVREGFGVGVNYYATLWSQVCRDCGGWLSATAPSNPTGSVADNRRDQTAQSDERDAR